MSSQDTVQPTESRRPASGPALAHSETSQISTEEMANWSVFPTQHSELVSTSASINILNYLEFKVNRLVTKCTVMVKVTKFFVEKHKSEARFPISFICSLFPCSGTQEPINYQR